MSEKRFNANGIVGVMIWKYDWDDMSKPPVPYIRLYEPRDPETGWAKKKPDGSHPNFKDYEIRHLVDPSIKIVDEHFEFVETDAGECYFDFSLRTLGKKPNPSDKEEHHEGR